ncbi:hypothetical protein [Mycobacterium sp. Root265]|uniref:hypothetical protein n=1 Tax=Mycobacterium sp. Root265 TaxID=1736504 RepID=UPI000A71C834|nr:hypothetical protein [Mycobacterium sp. Root265]
MSADQIRRLHSFYRRLGNENVVVEFDPNLPPQAGVSPFGAFAYRKRSSTDGGLMIRVNEFTSLTEPGRQLWKLPEQFWGKHWGGEYLDYNEWVLTVAKLQVAGSTQNERPAARRYSPTRAVAGTL